jgi:hypothetical protein
MGCIVILRVLLFLAAAIPSEASAARSLAALRPRLDPSNLPAVPAACVDGRGGWRTVRGDTVTALTGALAAFPWQARHMDPPTGCQRTLELLCAPDLDGDEQRDFLVRVRWRRPQGECDDRGVRHEAILVLKRGSSWRALDVVSYTAAGKTGLAEARVGFVQLPDGRIGFTCKTQTEKRQDRCKVLGFWVGAVVGDRIERLGEANPELCQPD